MKLINPINIISEEEQIYRLNQSKQFTRGTLCEIHIADIHFGALDPKYQYNILKDQIIDRIIDLPFNILSIDGDLFDHKYMSNSDVVMYASMFIDNLVNLCRVKNATLVILSGTYFHDAGQLKLFYHYLQDSSIDIRIVEEVKFEYIQGAKILCIPELYGMSEDYYNNFLLYSGEYDTVFMHGTIKGAVYENKSQEGVIFSDKAPSFTIDNFRMCKGPIISGHVHTPGCFSSHYYYTGTPYYTDFTYEGDKGFLILLHNLDTRQYHVQLEPIISDRYITININDMICHDPKDIISHIVELRDKQDIKYIRVEIDKELSDTELSNLQLLKEYIKNDKDTKIKYDNRNKQVLKANKKILEQNKEYEYILDKNLSEYEIFTRYVNQKKECEYITVDELINLLKEEM